MMTTSISARDVLAARDLAARLLANELPQRWLHVQSVASFATEIVRQIPSSTKAAIAAAWLHDIGYVSSLADTGFHPLDAARYLRANDWSAEICDLVAHHTNARHQASYVGLAGELDHEFTDTRSLDRDILWMSDAHAGPSGQRFTIEQRIDEIAARYGEPHFVTQSMREIRPDLEAALARVDDAIAAAERQPELPFDGLRVT